MSVARHTVYNLVGAAVPVAVSLVTVPLYIRAIGTDRYGLLAICWLLVGYFNLFDFGLGRATSQKIATLAYSSENKRSEIFWASALLSCGLSLVAILIFVPVASVGLRMMKLSPEIPGLRNEVTAAVGLLVAAVPFGIAQSVLVGALEGRREFLKINLIISFGTVATTVLPLVAARWIGPQLPHLLGAALLSRSCVLIMLVPACVRSVPVKKIHFPDSNEIKHLLSFGGWTTITNVIGPLMVFWDRFAMGAILGPAAVAIYVVPFNLVWQLLILPGALMSALFPKLASEDWVVSRQLSYQALSMLVFCMTPATILFIVLAPPFLRVWLGESLATKTSPIACILLFGIWANSLARIPHAHIQARARPKLVAYLMLAEVLPYIGFFFLFIRWIGLPGAAIAWSLRCAADTTGMLILDETSKKQLAPLLIQSALVIFAIVVSILVPTWSPVRLALAVITLGTSVAVAWPSRPTQMRQIERKIILSFFGLISADRSSHDV